jgi:hypothetical protein
MARIASVALLAGGLAAVHVFAGRLPHLPGVPHDRSLSLAGGVSVAYVFVHALPEITERQPEVETGKAAHSLLVTAGEHAVFLAALFGFAVFYGLEQLAVRSRRETDPPAVADDAEIQTQTQTSAGVFWLHIGSFAVYNALVGYLLLHREETGPWGLSLYFAAMALHFLVNDHGLREHHQAAYARFGRWILAAAVFVGVSVSYLVAVPETLISLLFAFLVGGIVLNVIKEELPEERESSFWAFGVGVAGYTLVLLLI